MEYNKKIYNQIENINYITHYLNKSKPTFYLQKYKYNSQILYKLLKKNNKLMLCNKSYLNKNNLVINNINNLNTLNINYSYIQEFINNPLIYKNKYVSIRIYIVIIKDLSNLVAFLYNDGILFLINDNNYKSYKYPDYFVHLFGKWNFINLIMPQIKDCIGEILENTYKKLCCSNNRVSGYRCYNLLSFDFICDCN